MGFVFIQQPDDGQCLLSSFRLDFFGALEVTAGVDLTLGVSHLVSLGGIMGISLIAITEQSAGKIITQHIDHVRARLGGRITEVNFILFAVNRPEIGLPHFAFLLAPGFNMRL